MRQRHRRAPPSIDLTAEPSSPPAQPRASRDSAHRARAATPPPLHPPALASPPHSPPINDPEPGGEAAPAVPAALGEAAWADSFDQIDEKEFRFQGTHGLLTYPNVAPGLTASSFAQLFESIFPKGSVRLRGYCVGLEHHLDGTPHFHVYFCLDRKPDFRSCRVFDLVHPLPPHGVLHCNIARVKRGQHQAAYEYSRKYSDYSERGIDLFTHSQGFVRKLGDFDSWCAYRERLALRAYQWPLTVPTGEVLHEPTISDRARIVLVTGPPDWGKSHWMEHTFAGSLCYKRPPNPGPYPYDSYSGEPIILIDDPQPSPDLHELIAVNNVYMIKTPVYGLTRYRVRYWPVRQARTTVIVVNDPAQLGYADDPRFTSRLRVHSSVLGLEPFQPADE